MAAPEPGAAVERGRHGADGAGQRLADLHDEPERARRLRGVSGRRMGGDPQFPVEPDQHPPFRRQHRLWRLNRGGLCGVQVPDRAQSAGTRPLRLDGLQRQFHRHLRAAAAAVRRLLPGGRDLCLQPADGDHADGRHLRLAVHHPGGADRHPVSVGQLLSVVRHGAQRRGAALYALHQVHRHRAGRGLPGLVHAAHAGADQRRTEGAGRALSRGARAARDHAGQEHGSECDDHLHLSQLSLLSPRQPRRGGAVGTDRQCDPGGSVRRRDCQHPVSGHLSRLFRQHRLQGRGLDPAGDDNLRRHHRQSGARCLHLPRIDRGGVAALGALRRPPPEPPANRRNDR